MPCNSNTCFLAGSVLTDARPGSECYLYIVMSRRQLFPVSYSASTTLWSFHLSSFQPIRNHCRFATDIYLFLNRVSLIILYLYETCDSRESSRNYDNSVLTDGLLPILQKQNKAEAVRWRFIFCPVCASQPLRFSPSLYYFVHFR